MNKIKTLPALKKIVGRLKKQGKRIAFTNGCFDLLHPGHIKTFTEAKKKSDVLIVGLNSDSSVRKIKGHQRPILDQKARAQVISAIAAVDYVTIFYQDTPFKLIQAIKPDLLVKGGDWAKEKIIGQEFAKKTIRINLKKGFSTSKIIQKIIENHA